MKIISALFIVIGAHLNTQGQSNFNSKTDSLTKILSALPDDTSKVNKLIELGDLYLEKDIHTSLKYGTQALELATEQNYLKGLGYAQRLMGRVFYTKDDYVQSIGHFEKALLTFQSIQFNKGIALVLTAIAKNHFRNGEYSKSMEFSKRSLRINGDLGNQLGIAIALNDVAVIYLAQGIYPKALDYYKSSLKISERLSDKREIAISLGNIGAIYFYEGDYTKALDYYNRSLKFSEEISRKEGIAANLVNIGEVYFEYGDYKKALEYFEKSLNVCNSILDKNGAAYALNNIGTTYQIQHDHLNALNSYKRSLAIRQEISDEVGITKAQLSIGTLSIETGKINEGIQWCNESMYLAKEINDIRSQKEACNCLYKAYKKKGDDKKALVFHELMLALEDSLNVKETDKKLQQFEFAKQLLQDSIAQIEKDRLIKDAHVEEVRQKSRIRNIAVLVGLFLMIFAAGLYSRMNYVRKSKEIIEAERDKSNNLLLNILPIEVANELKNTGESQARNFDVVTVLFTDFRDFTTIAEALSPQDLVAEINTCFKIFDQIITKYRIEKIKTIGDSYMAAGGLGFHGETGIIDTVSAAIEMQEFIISRAKKLCELGKPYFEMRAGIHTGPVVAGIVGEKKFQYDIWGDTVNIASRMESSGAVGKVNISQHSYELIKDFSEFCFESRGKVQAKNMGSIEMYFVSKVQSSTT